MCLKKKQAQRAFLRLALANYKNYNAAGNAVVELRVGFFLLSRYLSRGGITRFACWCMALDEIALHKKGHEVGRDAHSSRYNNLGRSYRLHVG